jgi:hypothetical protein
MSDIVKKPSGTVTSTTRAGTWLANRVKEMKTAPRLIFALDATISRQATWDMACELQGAMFREAKQLSLQLVFYRGSECKATRWFNIASELEPVMRKITCVAGGTQIGRVLSHCVKETERLPVKTVVFVGDAFEEGLDPIADHARALGRKNCPVFMFQEGNHEEVEQAYREIARLSGGAWYRFDSGAAAELSKLLTAAASYARGNAGALEDLRKQSQLLITAKKGDCQ